MANICTNFVTIAGPEKDLQDLRERINKQDRTLVDDSVCGHLSTGDGYGLEDSLPLDGEPGEALSLCITSKWRPPKDDYLRLSELYPNLTISVRYEEQGNIVYGTLAFKGGECIDDTEMEPFEYLVEFVEEFREFVEEIRGASYRVVRRKYIVGSSGYEGDPEWESHHDLLVPLVMERAKERDLPVLVLKPEFEELAKARLAGKTEAVGA